MTIDKAKTRLAEYITKMENGENITYAAILKDPIKADNYWFEYGTKADTIFSNYHLEKELDNKEKEVITERGKLIYCSSEDQEYIKVGLTEDYGNLLIDKICCCYSEKKQSQNNYKPILDEVRPLKAGIGISDYDSESKTGTLGCLFRATHNNSTNTYMISNMHVISRYNNNQDTLLPTAKHEKVVQPSFSNAKQLELQILKNTIGKTVWKMFDNEVDVAVALINEEIKTDKGFFNSNKKLIDEYIDEASEGYLNEYCNKVGYRTGFTSAKLLSVDAAIKVPNYYRNINGGGEFIIFRNQLMTDDMADNGDSGSILSYDDGTPLGLTFADISFKVPVIKGNQIIYGRTFHNKLSVIRDKMDSGINYNGLNHPLEFERFLTN